MGGSDTVPAAPSAEAASVRAAEGAAGRDGRPLAVRILRAVPLPPALAACVIGVAILAIGAAWLIVWDLPGSLLREGTGVLSRRGFWFDVFSIALLATSLWLLDLTSSSARRAVAELRGRLGAPTLSLDQAIHRATGHFPRRSVAAAIGGALAGIVFSSMIRAAMRRRGIEAPPLAFAWILARNVCVFAVFSQCLFASARVTRALAKIATAHLQLGWREAPVAAPLARHGLRLLFGWTIVACLVAFFLLDQDAAHWMVFFLAILVVQAAAVIGIPLAGVRARVRAAKQAELARLDREIERVGDGLTGGSVEPEAGWSRLGAIVAYRRYVAAAPETPVDTPALARLALYLLLPVGSWLGGALMERAVGWILG